ncbi:MAG: tRNA (adenosine(37)-N6)-threonylcarbamoyltransferase complex ATPase subunit type 1 TsaE, partial [Actinomycetota bacterium]
MIRATTRSVGGTESLASAIARVCRAGDVIVLSGPMGAGKTAFVRGLASG